MAGIFAFKDAMQKGESDPFGTDHEGGSVHPDEYQGELMGDLNREEDKYKAWKLEAPFASSRHLFHWKICSATPPTCDLYHPVAPIIR